MLESRPTRRTLLRAAAAGVCAYLSPGTARSDPDERILGEGRSKYNHVRVSERGSVRTMYFVGDDGKTAIGQPRREVPHRLARVAEHQRRGRQQAQVQLVVLREHVRRDQADQHPAERPAERQRQIKRGQVARVRPQPV